MNETVRIALIPAYQPGNNFPQFVERLSHEDFCPIVVDDGSGEDYRQIFADVSKYAYVLKHSVNRGKGTALKTGFTYIRDSIPFTSTIVTVDADGQHRIRDVKRIACEAQRNPEALLIGSRRFTGPVPFKSRMGNTITRFVFRKASGVSLHDTQTGLRAFSSLFLDTMLSIPGCRYEYEMNQLLYFAKTKQSIIEMPIATVYENHNRSSHFDPIKDSFLIYENIFHTMKA